MGKYCSQSDMGPPCFVMSSLASASSGEQGERVPWSFRQVGLGCVSAVNSRTITSRQRTTRICTCLDIVYRKVIYSLLLSIAPGIEYVITYYYLDYQLI